MATRTPPKSPSPVSFDSDDSPKPAHRGPAPPATAERPASGQRLDRDAAAPLTADEARRIRALAFEAVSEGVVITDSDQRILLVNPAFETTTGHRQGDVIGRTCAFLQGPLTSRDTLEAIRQTLRQHRVYTGEVLNYRKDGSTFWNDLSISPLRDEEGRLTHYIGLMRDISERKRTEAELIAGETRFRDAAEAAGGYILDMDTRFRYTFISERSEQLLGYAANELIGHTPAEFMPPGEIDRVNAWFETNLQPDGSVRGLEHRILTKSGQVRWLMVSRVPLRDREGHVTGHRGTAFDITDRKQAEAARVELENQVRESQKMEAIGTLAGGIAHDFNNIIAAILGNVNLARQDVCPASPALESLDQIHKAASRARDLVRQILSFSRREQTQYKRTSLAPIAQDTARMLRAMLPARVSIEVTCAADVPAVAADASQIQQVIINLATNAMQAMAGRPGLVRIGLDLIMPDASSIGRHLALREMYQHHPEGLVRLSVADDGPGMDQAMLGRIFEPFFTTKPVGEGTGLGLAVVHGIVQGHQGLITVDSQVGAGTRFDFYLPIDTSAPAERADAHTPDKTKADAAPSPSASALSSKKTDVQRGRPGTKAATPTGPHIVYVDDDEALIFLVKRLLERRGLRVSAYQDQQEALQTVINDPAGIDLFLTDYNMPGLSGLDLARKVREIRADLPVGIASGFIDETLSAEAADAGVKSLIFKATSVDEFCHAIEALLVPGA
jgi:two-component system, cell cycle sensor histidine kinase and response regulator CckA